MKTSHEGLGDKNGIPFKNRLFYLWQNKNILLSSSDIKVIIGLLLLYWLIRDWPSIYLQSEIYPFVIIKFQQSITQVIFIGLSIFVLFTTIQSIRKNYLNFGWQLVTLVFLTIVLFYETVYKDYVSILLFDFVSYFRVIVILLVIVALTAVYVLWTYSWSRNSSENIAEELVDQWGRLSDAKYFANRIFNYRSNRAGSLLISGNWGSGKTWFIKMILDELYELAKTGEKENIYTPIIIQINPWSIRQNESIGELIFKSIAEKFRLYDRHLASEILEFTNSLDGSKGFLSKVFGLLTGSERYTKAQLDEIINKRIEFFRLKLVVVVDDVDRLDEEEIMDLFKLVRNSGNYSNTFYILSFDRQYVVQALDSLNAFNPNDYIEKIYDDEYSLPFSEKNNIVDEINEIFNQLGLSMRINAGDGIKFYIEMFLSNHRDVEKFKEQIKRLNEKISLDNMDKFDLIGFVCLKVKYSHIISFIYTRRHYFFKFPDFFGFSNYSIELKNRSKAEDRSTKSVLITNIQNYLKEDRKNLGISLLDSIIISTLFSNMFGILDERYSLAISENTKGAKISDSRFFPSYFSDFIDVRVYKGELHKIIIGNKSKSYVEDYVKKFNSFSLLAALDELIGETQQLDDVNFEWLITIILNCGGRIDPYKHLNAKIIENSTPRSREVSLKMLESSEFEIKHRLEFAFQIIAHGIQNEISEDYNFFEYFAKIKILNAQLFNDLLKQYETFSEEGLIQAMDEIIYFHQNSWGDFNRKTKNIIISEGANTSLKALIISDTKWLKMFLWKTLILTNTVNSSDKTFYTFYAFIPQLYTSWEFFLDFLKSKEEDISSNMRSGQDNTLKLLIEYYRDKLNSFIASNEELLRKQDTPSPVKLSQDQIDAGKELGFFAPPRIHN